MLPNVDWLHNYRQERLRGDLVAGVAVAVMVVPKSLGHAGIANVPIHHGLYAAAAGAILHAILRQLWWHDLIMIDTSGSS